MTVKDTNTVIIITSDEPWGKVWHTQLHYAYELSRFFHVLFINPPVPGFNFSHNLSFKKKYVNDNLIIVNYVRLIPSTFGKIGLIINDFLTSISLKINLYKNTKRIILWRIDHFRLHYLSFINAEKKIYHVIDHWINFEEDEMLAKESDLVVYTSPRFAEHYQKLNSLSINIPQGVSRDEFNTDTNIVKELIKKYKTFLFTCGTISDSVDIDILCIVADSFPDLNLLVAGPVIIKDQLRLQSFNELKNKSNVTYLGIIPGKELKNYIKASLICLIHYPFSLQEKFSVRSPLKVLSYLAQMKPIVTSYNSEIDYLRNKAIFQAGNIDEYINYIRKILNHEITVKPDEIKQYLETVEYENLIKRILAELDLNRNEKKA